MPQLEKNSRFPYLLSIILFVLLVNTTRSVFDTHRSIGKIDDAKSELEGLKLQNERLRSDILYTQSPEYLQKAAIEELNMAKPGEIILIVEQSSVENTALEQNDLPRYEPEPLELWMTEFKLEEHYYNWQNSRSQI